MNDRLRLACDGSRGVENEALIRTLNDECPCIGLDEVALRRTLEVELGKTEWVDLMQERCPYVFAARPVFVADSQLQRMAEVVRAVESVVVLLRTAKRS
jgi:hypothetical protein